jgi:pimeloyl-ACP methyl ester carboxylesterase
LIFGYVTFEIKDYPDHCQNCSSFFKSDPMENEGFIEIKGKLLFYQWIPNRKTNNLPVLVFLHDALGSTAQWKDFPELLSKKTGLNTIVFDRQGYGKSASVSKKRGKNYLHEEAQGMLPAFLKKLKIERPILFGHSDGGTIALLYASRFHPLAIVCEAAHVLVEPETVNGIKKALAQKDLLIAKLKKYHGDQSQTLFEAWSQTWLAPDFADWNIEAQLQTINCPALIIQGEKDEYATLDQLEKIKKGIGEKARSVLIKDCGHIPHLEAQEEVLETTAKFIRNILKS